MKTSCFVNSVRFKQLNVNLLLDGKTEIIFTYWDLVCMGGRCGSFVLLSWLSFYPIANESLPVFQTHFESVSLLSLWVSHPYFHSAT